MLDETLIRTVRDGLFQPDQDIYIAPIRHHSPACAWAVQQMIRDLKPTQVLIEAPHDLTPLIPHLLDGDTSPPVAIASLLDREDGPRLAAYYPFCDHSPEWVALHEGTAIGAQLQFIDLGSDTKLLDSEPSSTRPNLMVQEHHFDSGDYVRALARKLGCRDGYELWDHLFETRIGGGDWRSFLSDVGSYCAGLRAATPTATLAQSGDTQREAHMAACLNIARKNMDGPIVVVVGGFHAPALLTPKETAGKTRPLRKSAAQSYLIRYGYRELDALMGYGAGLPQPGYYQSLWDHAQSQDGTPDWPEAAHDLIQAFAARMRTQGHGISVPAQTELLRSAQLLAQMRGRPGALRHDLIDGVKTALLKGESTGSDVWNERFLTFLQGHKMGQVSSGAGQPPIVADIRARARALRFDLGDARMRTRHLDIRRKPAHLAASRFAHAVTLLGCDFARRTAGPDFVNHVQTNLLFEDWEYAWSPRVEGQLIEAARFGDTLPAACRGYLAQARQELAEQGSAGDLHALLDLFKRGLLAGLGAELADFITQIEAAIRASGDFAQTAKAVCTLHAIQASRGPLSLPTGLAIAPLMQAAYARLIYLCDDLPNAREDALPPALDALRMLAELLRGPGGGDFDVSLFDAALDRVVSADPAAEIHGAVMAIAVQACRHSTEQLAAVLRGQFNGSDPDLATRMGGLRGMLWIAPSLLWSGQEILSAVDDFLTGLDEDGFLEILPHLRLALSALSPREADRLAQDLAGRHGGKTRDFTAHHHDIDAASAARGGALEARLRQTLQKDGLLNWVTGTAPQTPKESA